MVKGFVASSWQETEGKKKKRYYKITPQGEILLEMWTERIKERGKALHRFIKIFHQD
jgi:DNA-binding PadR family transcriptional regulator